MTTTARDTAGPAPGSAPEVPGYELGELLARGGTSEVWAGVGLDSGHRVAVKVVNADLGPLEAASREAAVSARAANAHVVAVEACLPLPDGRVAVVMPHLLGGAVDALVRARGHLSPGEVVTVLAPVASALGRLHDLGVVHGDVSPGNVLLDLDGRPVLGDLGLSSVVGDLPAGVWGTDGYVAPEVLLGGDPTPASDVYALGAVGWLCLTGTVPGPPGLRPELAQVSLAGEGSGPVVSTLAAAVGADPADRPSAHELAWLLFGAAQAEPLRLVHGDGEVSAVTYRLRAAAGRPPSVASPRPWWRRARMPWLSVSGLRGRPARASAAPIPLARSWPRPSRMPAPSVRAAGSTPGPVRVRENGAGRPGNRLPAGGRKAGRHAGLDVRRGSGGVALLVSAVVSGLILSLVALAVVALGDQHGAEPARPTTQVGSTTASDTRQLRAADPRADPHAPRTRPAELLEVLADRRAAAWRDATPSVLREADTAGSAAGARDVAAVSEVARAGVRYTGLRYTVAGVTTLSSSTTAAVLRARIDSSAYAVTSATGSTARGAVRGRPVLVDVAFTDVGWRVSDVRPAP